MTRRVSRTSSVLRAPVAAAALVALLAAPAAGQGTFGAVGDPCLSATGTPSAGSAAVAGVAVGTPMVDEPAGTPAVPADIDAGLLALDLLIAHQTGFDAVAHAAAPRIENARLREVAAATVASRQADVAELRVLRDRLSSGPAIPLDTAALAALDQSVPGSSIAAAQTAVDFEPAFMLAAMCDAAEPDRVFVDLAIPHHRVTVELARVAATTGGDDLRVVAERIGRERSATIVELEAIREVVFGSATPQPVAPGT